MPFSSRATLRGRQLPLFLVAAIRGRGSWNNRRSSNVGRSGGRFHLPARLITLIKRFARLVSTILPVSRLISFPQLRHGASLAAFILRHPKPPVSFQLPEART